MQKLYFYRLSGIKPPEKTTIDDLGNVYKCDKIEKNKWGFNYEHKESVGSFLVEKPASQIKIEKKKNEKYDIYIIVAEDLGDEVECYYKTTPLNMVWWMNISGNTQTIRDVIIPVGLDEPYSENLLGVAKKVEDNSSFLKGWS